MCSIKIMNLPLSTSKNKPREESQGFCLLLLITKKKILISFLLRSVNFRSLNG